MSDFFIVQDSGPNQYAISLGLFSTEAAAQSLLEKLRRQGITNARMTTRENPEPSSRIELRGPSDAMEKIRAFLADTLKTVKATGCSTEIKR